jgi:signal transduction histidine kinase
MTQPRATAPVRRPAPADREWVRLVDGAAPASRAARRRRPPTARRVLTQFVLANLVAVTLLLGGSIWASGRAAATESLADARTATDVLATVVFEPQVSDALLTGDPAAIAALNDVTRDALRDTDLVRVKIWSGDGRIVYSDERRLIGSAYTLAADDLEALDEGGTVAEISDLSRPENRFERTFGVELLEVYTRIRTPAGEPLLFETYRLYEDATSRQVDILLTFAPISGIALLLLLAMQLPLGDRMVRQLREGEQERTRLLVRAADASTDERRRIAGTLHDGIVQDLSAAQLVVTSSADRLDGGTAPDDVVPSLRTAGGAVRDSVTSLRSLLVEIYPPHLAKAGLPTALRNLAARLQPRGVHVEVEVLDELDPPAEVAALVFRVAQESLINVAKHARAGSVDVCVREEDGAVVLEVADDGVGFDAAAAREATEGGHFGLAVLRDLAAEAGATLDLATAPGAGTALRLRVPCREAVQP